MNGFHQAVAAEQAARRAACQRPPRSQRHLLGPAFGRAVARSAGELWAYTTCYNRFALRRAGVWDQIVNALTADHDVAVQMIDTSIVRVRQHGACIAGNQEQLMGRPRGGLTSTIHAVVDTIGLPVRAFIQLALIRLWLRVNEFAP
jgi:hypothetical protein